MSELKLIVASYFEDLGHWIYRHKIITLIITFSIVGVLTWQMITHLTIDTSSEAMLHDDDPHKIVYNNFKSQFGNSDIIYITIKPPDIFHPSFLIKLKSFHEDLENEVPYVREITSLINARNTYGDGDTLYVDDLLQGWPEKGTDLAVIKKLALNNLVYKNNILSDDGRMTALVIECEAFIGTEDDEKVLNGFEENAPDEEKHEKTSSLSAKENKMVVEAMETVISRYKSPEFSIAYTGGPVIATIYNRTTGEDTGQLALLANIIVIVFLTMLFRRISGVFLPVIIVTSSLFSTMGIMAFLDYSITLFSVVIPSFLVAVGIADSVHILAIFYRHFQQGAGKEEAITYALGHSGTAVLMTSLTTAAGLLSFSFSELSALAELGKIAAIGVILAFIYTMVMLPALVALIPIKQKQATQKRKGLELMDRLLQFCTDFSTTHYKKIIVVSFVMFIIFLFGLSKLSISHHTLTYFRDYMQVKHDVLLIEKVFKGSLVIEAVADTKKENGIYNPSILNRIDNIPKILANNGKAHPLVGKIFSINDILKETHQALHGNDPSFYKIPQDYKTIAQELFLFENSGSDDLERVVDSQFSKTRISIKIPWVDIVEIDAFVTELNQKLGRSFQNIAEITITGMSALMGRTISAAMHSMAKSYIIAFVVITLMMLVLVGNFKFGLLSMIPNLLPIMISMGLMGLIGIPLDMTALMIGSIAMGLVVDDTMHFMYNYEKYYSSTGNSYKAVQETLLGTGRAILITSLVLSANFFSLMTATLKNSVTFGFFTGLVILIAVVADFILAPALMVYFSD